MVKELRVSIFANLQAYASKDYSIDEVIRLVKYDTFVKQKTAAYRQMASIISREEANKRIKVERTEAFAVSVLYDGSGKQPENIVRFTGLAMVDLDKMDNGQLTITMRIPVSSLSLCRRLTLTLTPLSVIKPSVVMESELSIATKESQLSIVNRHILEQRVLKMLASI